MSGKNQYITAFNWQTTNPQTGFFPNPNQNSGGSIPSGTVSGVMTGTNTIYTNIIEVSRMDNQGLEVVWTGTPVGTISVLGNNSGIAANWFALTFNPALTQPSGSAAPTGINLNQFPWKYVMLSYVNSSGSGTISVYNQLKDLN